MAKIYTGQSDEKTIELVKSKGLETPLLPKWVPLRIALALSLRLPDSPNEEWEKIDDRNGGSEYSYEQLTGEGKENDYTQTFCALLSTYHNLDLFSDPELYRKYLQRHIRRGLHEIRTTWTDRDDFHAFLMQDIFTERMEKEGTQTYEPSPDLEAIFLEIGISGLIKTSMDGVRISRYLIHLQDLRDLERLEKNIEKVAFSMGKETGSLSLTRTNEPRLIGLDIPRGKSTWKNPKIDFSKSQLKIKGFRLPVSPGVKVMGDSFVFDLASAPHLLIGGTTGSGKSVCIHALILSLLKTNLSDMLKLCFIDAKHVEFNDYNDLKDYLFLPVITETEDAYKALLSISDEMSMREKKFAAKGVRNIDEYINAGESDIPRIIIIVDELADLILKNGEIESILVTLAQKARSAGIHLILATQRPDAQTFTGLLRSNIPSRIALTVQKSSESKIIIDEIGAERLTGYGDMIVKLSGERSVRVHGFDVKQKDIVNVIQELSRR